MTNPATGDAGIRWLPIKLIGVALTVASLVYIGRELLRAEWPAAIDVNIYELAFLIALSIGLYAAATSLLAFLWWRLVRTFHEGNFSFAAAFRIYATTQIYKYLPSNVFHFVGRHVAANRLGVGGDILALAVLAEMFMLIVAAACMSLPLIFLLEDLSLARLDLSQKERFGAIVIVSILFVATSATVGFVYMRRSASFQVSLSRIATVLAGCQLGYVVFFLAFGIVGIALVSALPSDHSVNIPITLGTMSLAWLLGFVVPGAPAGVGIREATMVILLAGSLGAAHALFVALSFRIVTLLGDILIALIGAAVPKEIQAA